MRSVGKAAAVAGCNSKAPYCYEAFSLHLFYHKQCNNMSDNFDAKEAFESLKLDLERITSALEVISSYLELNNVLLEKINQSLIADE
ncbi:hypothetical protein CAP35_09590 [Chitinophagaceae bacterium IBVUCB1]|nr:hypothetical protein CAP35_09590 [Chitinophagaceae bacterium IBVUCB1]